MEPLFQKQANALQIFRQWVVFKIIKGIAEGIDAAGAIPPSGLTTLAAGGNSFIHNLETGNSTKLPENLIAPSELLNLIEEWLKAVGRKRCVLLLDDAAHAFSPEQQRDFFEVFRALRSKMVAAKAAIYPGITTYSPFFHVGHEAEPLEAWYSPDDESYLQTMREVAQSRLPPALYKLFEDRLDIIDFLALASFGLPRGFLNMLSSVLALEEDTEQKVTRKRAEEAVATHAESITNIFASLKNKLPRFKNFVEVGIELEHAISKNLRFYN